MSKKLLAGLLATSLTGIIVLSFFFESLQAIIQLILVGILLALLTIGFYIMFTHLIEALTDDRIRSKKP